MKTSYRELTIEVNLLTHGHEIKQLHVLLKGMGIGEISCDVFYKCSSRREEGLVARGLCVRRGTQKRSAYGIFPEIRRSQKRRKEVFLLDKVLIHEMVKNNEVFRTLAKQHLELLLSSAFQRRLAPGEALYSGGWFSDKNFCLVLSGALVMLGENQRVLLVRGPGEMAGEDSLFIPHRKRTFTIVAAETSEVLEWNFLYLNPRIPQLRKELFRRVWRRFPQNVLWN